MCLFYVLILFVFYDDFYCPRGVSKYWTSASLLFSPTPFPPFVSLSSSSSSPGSPTIPFPFFYLSPLPPPLPLTHFLPFSVSCPSHASLTTPFPRPIPIPSSPFTLSLYLSFPFIPLPKFLYHYLLSLPYFGSGSSHYSVIALKFL